MSLIDKFLDAIKLNDDFDQDDDYLDDENEEPAEEAAEEPVEEERSRRPRAKTRKRFLQKFADRKEARKYDEDERKRIRNRSTAAESRQERPVHTSRIPGRAAAA